MSLLVPLFVVLPLFGAALTLLLGHRSRAQVAVSVVTLSATFVLSAIMLVAVDAGTPLAVSGDNTTCIC